VSGKDIGAKLRRAWRFILEDVWDIELSSLSWKRGFGIKALRVAFLVLKGFREDECPLHASALTFSTLMAIVPILALSLSLARVFGGDDLARSRVQGMISDWTRKFETSAEVAADDSTPVLPDKDDRRADAETGGDAAEGVLTPEELATQIENLVNEAFSKVQNISFTTLSGVGLVLLVWMVIAVLGRVEAAFNRVWGVTEGRSIWRCFTDYLSVVLILPFLVIAASSLPVADFATRFADESTAKVIRTFLGSGVLKDLTVVVMTTLCFGFVTMFMPNTRVGATAGLAGGTVAGLLFIGWMWLCAALQVGAAKYGKIYGSFAIVPIILAWVYVSWQIVLLGAEVAFAVQNCSTYRMEQGARRANVQSRIILALSVVMEAARAMLGEAKNFEASDYARSRRVPVRFLNDIVDELVQAGCLAELSEKRGCFVLLKSPGKLRVNDIVDVVLRSGVKPEAVGLTGLDRGIEEVVNAAEESLDRTLSDSSIEDLLRRGAHGAGLSGTGS